MPFDDKFATSNSGPRSKVHDVVGRAHRVFIMFDDNNRVALVAKMLKTFQQHCVVARMKTDRRFVQNVNNPHQTAANLPSQSNAL